MSVSSVFAQNGIAHLDPATLLRWIASTLQALGYLATLFEFVPMNLGLLTAALVAWMALALIWRHQSAMLTFHVVLTAVFVGLTTA